MFLVLAVLEIVCPTVDFTSDGTPVGVAVGNLWLVRLATFILQPMEHTNHKFPAAKAILCRIAAWWLAGGLPQY